MENARRAAGYSLREFTKVFDATAIPASRGLNPAAQVVMEPMSSAGGLGFKA